MNLNLCFLFLFGIKIINFFSLLLELKSTSLSKNSKNRLFSSPSPSKKGFIVINYIHSKINSNKIPRAYFRP